MDAVPCVFVFVFMKCNPPPAALFISAEASSVRSGTPIDSQLAAAGQPICPPPPAPLGAPVRLWQLWLAWPGRFRRNSFESIHHAAPAREWDLRPPQNHALNTNSAFKRKTRNPARLRQFGIAPELAQLAGFVSLLIACLGLAGLNFSSHHALNAYGQYAPPL